ncbi:MAG TPA: alpha/beta hydrolase [Alphaproteobacteria bacterium]|nr:alpha/beta hydrolase [Alphaproteobacteria bacterium]
MAYIQVAQDINLFVQDWGSGKPVVFIHGWPLNHKCFEYQFTQLPQNGIRCIGIDLRGFGDSDKPWGDYNYDIFADDILKVLRQLNLDDVTLVGHSMGGAIAIRYLVRHSNERISKAVLVSPAAPRFTQIKGYPYGFTKEVCNQFIDLCYTDRPQLLENFGKIFFYKESDISPKFAGWFHNLGMDASPHATAMTLMNLRDTDLREEMALLKVPTFIIHGTEDRVCPFQFAEVLHKGIKGSTLIPYKENGHAPFYDENLKFNQDLIKIINNQYTLREKKVSTLPFERKIKNLTKP